MDIHNISLAPSPVSTVEAMPVESPVPKGPAAQQHDKVGAAVKINGKVIENQRPDTKRPVESAQKEEKNLSLENAKMLVEEMNEIMDDLRTSLGFSIKDEFNKAVVVEIKNRETDELVKQIPSEEMLEIKKKMEEFTGLIFDQSV